MVCDAHVDGGTGGGPGPGGTEWKYTNQTVDLIQPFGSQQNSMADLADLAFVETPPVDDENIVVVDPPVARNHTSAGLPSCLYCHTELGSCNMRQLCNKTNCVASSSPLQRVLAVVGTYSPDRKQT